MVHPNLKTNKSRKFHNDIAEEYEGHYTNRLWKLYFEITWTNIKKYLPKKDSLILDAGGGTGFWSRKLASIGYKVICTDIAEKMLKEGSRQAKKEKVADNIEFKIADLEQMDCFKDNTFEMVISEGDSIGYCANPRKAIKEISRVSKKGAYIIISIDGFHATLRSLLIDKDYRSLDRLIKTQVSEFQGKFDQYNFQIDEIKTIFKQIGITFVDAIGKINYLNTIPRKERNLLLQDNEFYNKAKEVEKKFSNDQSIIGLSGHIEVVGKKK